MHTALPVLALAALLCTNPATSAPALDRAGSAPSSEPPPGPARGLARQIHVCVEHGVQVLADRPCGAEFSTRQLALRTPPAPGGQSSTLRVAPPARMHRAPARMSRETGTEGAACERLYERLAALDGRMRQGYRAREAGGLWEQRRALKQALRKASC